MHALSVDLRLLRKQTLRQLLLSLTERHHAFRDAVGRVPAHCG